MTGEPPATPGSGPDAGAPSLLRALLVRPRTTALLLLLGAVLGGLLPVLRPPVPVAETTLLLAEPVGEGEGATDGRVFVRAQAAVASTAAVQERAWSTTSASHPGLGRDELAAALSVSLAAGEAGLVFRVRHPDAALARTAARAAADAYREARRTRLRAEAETEVARLDALDRSLLALPATTRRQQVRDDVARARARALVATVAADDGVVAEVPVELEDEGVVRTPVAAVAGLLAGVVPAVVVGHTTAVSARRRASPAVLGVRSRAGELLVPMSDRAPHDADGWAVLATLLPVAPPGRTTQVAVLASGGRAAEQAAALAAARLDAAARRSGLRTAVVEPGAPVTAAEAAVALRPAGVTGPRGRAAAVLRAADTAVLLCRRGRHREPDLWAAAEQLAAFDVPLLAVLVPSWTPPRWAPAWLPALLVRPLRELLPHRRTGLRGAATGTAR